MEVVLASLERAQECLQGENPLATLFWNDDSPKKEEEITPWITQQLKGDLVKGGVVLDREVVISPTKRLDILVTAQAYDTKECRFYPLTLIIEIKRDINPGIDHSMQTQLDERYLTDNNCRTGLYLVAWFDSKHSRRTTRERLEARRESLAIQARKLSSPERHICSQVLDFSLETRPKSKKEASKLKGKVLRVRNPGAS